MPPAPEKVLHEDAPNFLCRISVSVGRRKGTMALNRGLELSYNRSCGIVQLAAANQPAHGKSYPGSQSLDKIKSRTRLRFRISPSQNPPILVGFRERNAHRAREAQPEAHERISSQATWAQPRANGGVPQIRGGSRVSEGGRGTQDKLGQFERERHTCNDDDTGPLAIFDDGVRRDVRWYAFVSKATGRCTFPPTERARASSTGGSGAGNKRNGPPPGVVVAVHVGEAGQPEKTSGVSGCGGCARSSEYSRLDGTRPGTGLPVPERRSISPCHERKIYGDICVDFRELLTAGASAGHGAKVGEKHGNGNWRVRVRR
ncbi:hypothetical protein EDB92DRAFT_1815189 [Lactarius akahatsu]|uniref:Uncharacterized protein n=1 Tax=Lactarius akahatsu TaxID=416441 RepID=A0AAD4LKD7_9AGAM|nr:hypothetical protein EDB92DRAFT_1815189 [Lactarius akahatsu]